MNAKEHGCQHVGSISRSVASADPGVCKGGM